MADDIILRWDAQAGEFHGEDPDTGDRIPLPFDGLIINGDADFGEGSTLVHDRDEITSTTATTDGSAYYLVDSDAAGAEVTVTLASADAEEGREINIKRDGVYDVTINTESTETIDGSNSIVLNQDQQSVTLVYNSADSDWEVW